MASKLQEYRRMSEEAQRQSFLAAASRLYKYPYHEQVIQNPNGSNIDSHMAPNSLKFTS